MEDGALEIRLLGPVEAARDGVPVALGGPRQRALLGLLGASVGRRLAVDRIVDELWAGEPPDGAALTLRSYVSRLRESLGPGAAVRAVAGGYELAVAREIVDAARFEDLVREAEAHAARRRPERVASAAQAALALWRGEAFGDVADRGALQAEAARLGEIHLRALELRLQAELDLGGASNLVDELEALVREHPYHEAFWRQLMLALYRAERQADALAAYHRARAALDESLGVEPGPELRAVEAAILQQDVPAVTPARRYDHLPVPISSFIGREAEVRRVVERLAGARLLTLSGVGGVGKTRLAIEAARSAAAGFADGVVFLDLEPVSEAGRIASNLAALLDLREQPGVEPIDRLVEHLADREVLLVLDNCEHVRDGAAELAERLLASCPDLRIISTSRVVLGVPGEAEEEVRPLRLPGPDDDPATSREADAVRLFVARARAARGGLVDDDALVAAAVRICTDLDGLPLGIELAAARARVLSAAEIADRLRDRFRFLVSWRRVTSARHRTLREAMDWSYDLLDAEAQRLLAELSVFAGSFTLQAVAGVGTGLEEARALDVLTRLVDASLVSVDHDVEPTRYRLLETVREYAAEHLADGGRTAEVQARHVRHFAAWAQAAWQPIQSTGLQEAWIASLALDRENLRAALRRGIDLDLPESTLQIAEALWWSWWVRGEVTEGRGWLRAALDAAPAADRRLRARGHLGAAGLAWTQGDLDAAQQHGEIAAQLFDELGDDLQAGGASNTLGLVFQSRGDHETAVELFRRAVERFTRADIDEAKRSRNLAVTIDNLGSVALELGQADEAVARYREAQALNRAMGDREGVAMNDLHLALVESERGRWEGARAHLIEALAVYRDTSFLHYLVECLEVAAALANARSEPAFATRLLGAADQVRAQLGAEPVPIVRRLRDREVAAARAGLSDAESQRARAAGAGAPLDRILGETLEFLRA